MSNSDLHQAARDANVEYLLQSAEGNECDKHRRNTALHLLRRFPSQAFDRDKIERIVAIVRDAPFTPSGFALKLLVGLAPGNALDEAIVFLGSDNPNVRTAGAEALTALSDPRTVDALGRASHDASRAVRWQAVDGLAAIGNERAKAHLVQAQCDPNLLVRRSARKHLKRLGSEH